MFFSYKRAENETRIASCQLDTYHGADNRFDIEKPSKDKSLLDFIIQFMQLIEDDGKGHRLEYRGLRVL